jgi:hypothetical protein
VTPRQAALAALDVLSDDAIHAYMAARRAQRHEEAYSFAAEQARLAEGADVTTSLVYRLIRVADTWRGLGCDDDVIARVLVERLVAEGVGEDEAVKVVLAAGLDWPRMKANDDR